MQALIDKIVRKVAHAVAPAIYPVLRRHAVKCPDPACDASGLAALAREFRPAFVGMPSPDRSAWPEAPEVDVSFIVPCYNVARYVTQCIESILSQTTSRSFEVIAVDDGSTDATGVILDDLAEKDIRLRVLHQANRGISGARNSGLERVRGGVIIFVDSDDLLPNNALELLVAPLGDPSVGFTSGRHVTMDEKSQVSDESKSMPTTGFPWGHAFRRECWRDIEFPEGYWFEDTVIKYCIFGFWRELTVDAVDYHYRVNRKGISHTSRGSKKSLHTVWIVQQMLEWRRALGGAFDQPVFNQTLRQFGPLSYDRLDALDSAEKHSAFALMCDVFASVPEFERMDTVMQERWRDVLIALRTRNYRLWNLACYFL